MSDKQRRGTCIFCGGVGLSKEHILPQWVQKILPPDRQKFTEHFIERSHPPGFSGIRLPDPKKYRRLQQGDPLIRTLRVVCKTCNNGWMSQLQEAARPILTPLIEGKWIALAAEQQITLGRWITMTSMVFEFADPGTGAVWPSERAAFRQTLDLPRWEYFVAKWHEPNRRFQWHLGIADPFVDGSAPNWCVMQATAISLGEVIFWCCMQERHSTGNLGPAADSPMWIKFPSAAPLREPSQVAVRSDVDREMEKYSMTAGILHHSPPERRWAPGTPPDQMVRLERE